jgi:hypothetical protein
MRLVLILAMTGWLALGLGAVLAADEGKTPTTAPAAKIVNTKCPMTGKTIDPAKVPANLAREFKDQKVGFCCPMCPPAWDKLSDADKEAKLAAAMKPEPPKTEK